MHVGVEVEPPAEIADLAMVGRILVEAGEKKLLFDCGRGATQRIEQIGIPFTEIDALFLTHLHSDHTVGIPDLWLTGWRVGAKFLSKCGARPEPREMMLHLKEAFQYSDPPGRRRTACACRRHSVHGHRARRRV